jgi:hypothetical protein
VTPYLKYIRKIPRYRNRKSNPPKTISIKAVAPSPINKVSGPVGGKVGWGELATVVGVAVSPGGGVGVSVLPGGGVEVGVGVSVNAIVTVGVGVSVGVPVGTSVGVAVGTSDGVGDDVGVGVGEDDGEG